MKFLRNTQGIILEQKKEPALSRDLQPFVSSQCLTTAVEPLENEDTVTLDQLIRLCSDASIIDERDGQPLGEKLKRWRVKPPQSIVADAIDDEPYVSSQINPMLKESASAAKGLRLLQKTLQPKDSYFAIYREMCDINTQIPKTIEEFSVRKVGGRYPTEQRAIRRLGENTLTVGVGSLIHLARAAEKGTVQSTCFVTVAGNCIGNPCNLEVSIGTPISQLLDRCGLIQDPTYLMANGAMRGITITDPHNTVVRPTTRAILAFREAKKTMRHTACMGCSRCVEVCPEGLNPLELYRASIANRRKTAVSLGVEQCIGCSTCSYICPSKLELSYTIIAMAQKIKKGGEGKDEN